MSKSQKKKYVILSSLAVLIIAINIYIFFEPDRRVWKESKNVNYYEYYDKKFPELNITNNRMEMYIPCDKNLLLLGLNNQFDKYLKYINKFYENLGKENYNLDIYLLTKREIHDKKLKIPIFNYYDTAFEKFFQLDSKNNFTILIESNVIKYYKAHIIEFRKIKSMISKHKIK